MGEITKADRFGSAIISIVRDHNLHRVLEIGSWDGTGSTQCFIEGMREFSKKELICLEIQKDKFLKLKENTSTYPWVKCFNQTSISYDNLVYKNFNEIWNSPYNGLTRHKTPSNKDTVNEWFNVDIETIKRFKTGYIEDTIDDVYDGVLIDGSEFTGYSEFKLLKNKTKVFFLDDYYCAFKTNQVVKELLNDGWIVLDRCMHTRNGFAILKHP